MIRVLIAAHDLSGSWIKSMVWICTCRIRVFGNQTPLRLVMQGKGDAVVEYIESISSGYVG